MSFLLAAQAALAPDAAGGGGGLGASSSATTGPVKIGPRSVDLTIAGISRGIDSNSGLALAGGVVLVLLLVLALSRRK